MEDQSEWTCSANDAVEICMVQPGDGDKKLQTISTFSPEFTYPIFGDEESIFGYKNLAIRLRFAAHDLRSNVHISYDERFKQVQDITAVDLLKTLKPFLPKDSFSTLDEFEQSVTQDNSAKDFTPPGKLVHRYSRRGRNYEIWAGSLNDKAVRTLLDRMQIFVSLFIEAGTPIVTDDFDWTLERWTVYFTYEKLSEPPTPAASPYSLVGYATTYRWYFFNPEASKTHKVPVSSEGSYPFESSFHLATLPARLRIAQFLVLPSHQLSGHGNELYRTIHNACLDDPTIYELTIEDPNEAFDALRDTNDYHILEPEFNKEDVSINPNPFPASTSSSSSKPKPQRHPRLMPTSLLIPTKKIDAIRHKFKIAPTQFAHILEMYLLNRIPESRRGSKNVNMARLVMQKSRAENEDDRRYYWWRMLVKQRLYKRHRDMLVQIDKSERIEKLDETLRNVEEGYECLLKAFAIRKEGKVADLAEGDEQGEEGGEAEEDVASTQTPRERTKRKFTVFEESSGEDEGGEAGAQAGVEGSGKKAKV